MLVGDVDVCVVIEVVIDVDVVVVDCVFVCLVV